MPTHTPGRAARFLLHAVVCVCLWPAAANADARPTGPTVSYELDAALDAEKHQIAGSGVIVLNNLSDGPVFELRLHLYLNAFLNNSSLFYRSPAARARGGAEPRHWGGIELSALRRGSSGADLLRNAAVHSPGDPLDRTNIVVPLEEPIEAGETARFEVEWLSRLPSVVDRTGFVDDFHFAGQWYPKLAKLEKDASWADFPFHPHGEFYANFGDYDVSITVPNDFVVGASGKRVEEQRSGETTRYRYRVDDVTDFAFAAWPHFQERRTHHAGVDIRLLYPPGHEHNAELTLRSVQHGLSYYGRRFGVYPHPTLTVVHPPGKARGAGGMEYPTLFTTGGDWYDGYLTKAVEQVTLHELGHQWFQGLLASHEARWPFLDEGLTSYADSQALEAAYGDSSGLSLPYVPISSLAYYRLLGNARGQHLPIGLAAAEFPSFGALGGLVYGRTTSVLCTYERVYGSAVTNALNSYGQAGHFTHPTPAVLLDAFEEHLQPAAVDDLAVALFDRGWVDYAVTELHSARAPEPRGDPVPFGATVPTGYTGSALITRSGDLHFPVDIELVTENGERLRHHWDGQGDSYSVEYSGEARLVSAVLDPDHRILLDQDLTNNARSTHPKADTRLRAWLTAVTQFALHLLSP